MAAAAEWERDLGATDWQTVTSRLAVARDLRYLGRYDDAVELARGLADVMDQRSEPWNFLRLGVYAELSVSLRLAGYYAEAHDLAEDLHRRYVEYVGHEHRATLVLATSLICARRVVDDLPSAAELGEATIQAWDKVTGPGHPNALAARANHAVTSRMRGYPAPALEMNQAALAGFEQLTPEHPQALRARQRGRVNVDITPATI
jgi:hypothetical protein